jgi:pyrimidine operon attenuation protein/uracil phosphoribosyltransferase
MVNERLILDHKKLQLTIKRLCYQLIENHHDFSNSVIIGLQPRGVFMADRIHKELEAILNKKVLLGRLDVTFFRDDFRRRANPLIPNATSIDFTIENKRVILIDDVLYTGRTIRSGLDAMLAYGRPADVELMVLVDRRYSRHLPVEANYIGTQVDSISEERVKVEWKEADGKDQIILYTPE